MGYAEDNFRYVARFATDLKPGDWVEAPAGGWVRVTRVDMLHRDRVSVEWEHGVIAVHRDEALTVWLDPDEEMLPGDVSLV